MRILRTLPLVLTALASLSDGAPAQSPSWSTYYGGAGDEGVAWNGVAQLPNGHVVVVGPTSSTALPVPNAFQSVYGGGTGDGFVACFDPNATGSQQLVWATYLGGIGYDEVTGVAVAANGDVLVCGLSNSPNLPTTSGSLQPSLAGGYDWFVARLRWQASSLSLVSCSYLGGIGNERAVAIAEQSNGNLVIVGWSDVGFPAAGPCSYQPSPGGGVDSVIALLDGNITTLLARTWFGLGGTDTPSCLALDGDRPVIGGSTTGGIPTTAGAYQPTFLGGPTDGFVARFDANLCTLQYATHLGGGAAENLQALAVMPNGAGYAVGGWTGPGNPMFPTTIPPGYGGGAWDAFVATLDPSAVGLAQLSWSRLAGGPSSDGIWSLAVDGCGLITAVGETASGTAGDSDVWIGRFDPLQLTTSSVPFSTTIGGAGSDRAYGVALDANGDALVAGSTTSVHWPTTPLAFQTIYAGGSTQPWSPTNPLAGYGDVFIMRLPTPPAIAGGFQQLPAGCPGTQSAFSGTPLTGNTVTFDTTWSSPGNTTGNPPLAFGFLVADFGGHLGWNGLTVPQPLDPLGMTGCVQVAGIDVTAPFALVQNGPSVGWPPAWPMQGGVTIALPNGCFGWSFAVQALLLNSHDAVTVTDGWRVTVGLR